MLALYTNIKKRREELGMSQEELAKKTGYSSRSMIAKIEAGKIDLYQSKVKEIADALEISIGSLMGWDTDTNQGQPEPRKQCSINRKFVSINIFHCTGIFYNQYELFMMLCNTKCNTKRYNVQTKK